MRTKPFFLRNELRFIVIVLICLLCQNPAKTQTRLTYNLPDPYNIALYKSEIIQHDLGSQHRLGIGIDFPQAKFHIKEPLSGFPIFTVDCANEHSSCGSIRHLFYNGNMDTTYGIFQSGIDFTNYFQGKIGCKSFLFFQGANSAIDIAKAGSFPFIMRLSPSSNASVPMELFKQKVKISDTLECNKIMIHYNAGANKVLVSDQFGNGNWINPASFIDNMWNRNAEGEIFTIDNVGIGSEDPQDKLQVNEGINKLVMGIGTTDIYDKDRSSELTKNPKGAAMENPRMINSALGYLGFNMVNTPEGWLVSGDGEHNYGSSIIHDYRGSMHFCVIEDSEEEVHEDQLFTHDQMYDKIKMTITGYGGVGIGTALPLENLDVNSNGYTFIRARAFGPYSAGFRLQNSKGGYDLFSDNNGIGKLSEQGVGPIMSFHSGNVDFAGNVGVAGKVGIGAVDLSQYSNSTSKLFVEGGITTEAVHVKLKSSGWSDFVFADDYKLRSISELDQFIKSHKHLPEIPTNSDVDENGVDLGRMNALLLQKVEELTLYIIAQQKQIDLLNQALRK